MIQKYCDVGGTQCIHLSHENRISSPLCLTFKHLVCFKLSKLKPQMMPKEYQQTSLQNLKGSASQNELVTAVLQLLWQQPLYSYYSNSSFTVTIATAVLQLLWQQQFYWEILAV